MRIFHAKNIFGLRGRGLLILAFCLMAFSSLSGLSQDKNRRRRQAKQTFNQAVEYKKDSVVLSDSLKAVRDSLHKADSLFKLDSIALQRQSSLVH